MGEINRFDKNLYKVRCLGFIWIGKTTFREDQTKGQNIGDRLPTPCFSGKKDFDPHIIKPKLTVTKNKKKSSDIIFEVLLSNGV